MQTLIYAVYAIRKKCLSEFKGLFYSYHTLCNENNGEGRWAVITMSTVLTRRARQWGAFHDIIIIIIEWNDCELQLSRLTPLAVQPKTYS